MKPQEIQHVLIIDTDSYAGNFERELTYYLSGKVYDPGLSDYAKEINNIPQNVFNWFELNLEVQTDDEHGNDYCNIDTTPPEYKKNNSVVLITSKAVSNKILEYIKKRAEEFTNFYRKQKFGDAIKILGVRRYKKIITYSEY